MPKKPEKKAKRKYTRKPKPEPIVPVGATIRTAGFVDSQPNVQVKHVPSHLLIRPFHNLPKSPIK